MKEPLGKIATFAVPANAAWQKIDPRALGITDQDILDAWDRRRYIEVYTSSAINIAHADPGATTNYHTIAAGNWYLHYGGDLWVLNDTADITVLVGY